MKKSFLIAASVAQVAVMIGMISSGSYSVFLGMSAFLHILSLYTINDKSIRKTIGAQVIVQSSIILNARYLFDMSWSISFMPIISTLGMGLILFLLGISIMFIVSKNKNHEQA